MNRNEITAQPVGRLVASDPRLAKIFERFQIDYCCRGGHTLAEACRDQNVSLDELLADLERTMARPEEPDEPDWTTETLCALADHIEQVHHTYVRAALPRVTELIAKVVRAHGETRPELLEVSQVFQSLRCELESHMLKEERVLFPAVRVLEAGQDRRPFPFGSVNNPIRAMVHEHEEAGGLLQRLYQLTEGYQPPRDACPTYRVMLSALSEFEQDLHRHIHKENNILFPRAAELEQSLLTIAGR